MVPRLCPVCESERRKILFEDVNRREGLEFRSAYWRCRECRMIYLHPMPDWAQFQSLYKEIFREFEMNGVQPDDVKPVEPFRGSPPPGLQSSHWLRRVFPHPRLTPVETSPSGTLSVLDVGCGTGSGLIPFYWSGWSVTGVDINPLALEVCTELMPRGRFIEQDFIVWGPAGEAFDVVRIDNCLEHIPEPKVTLAKMAGLLKPGGRAYIFVPSGSSFLFKVFGRYHVSSWIPFHLNLFTLHAMRRICEEAGLEIERLHTWQPHTWLKLSLRQWAMKQGCYQGFAGEHHGRCDKAWKAVGAVLSILVGGDEIIAWARKKTSSSRSDGVSRQFPGVADQD